MRNDLPTKEVPLPLADAPDCYQSSVIGIWVVKAAAGIPFTALVAVCGYAVGFLQHASHVHEIPGHKGGIALRKIVFRSSGTLIGIGLARTGLSDPTGIGLGRNDIAEMLKCI